MRKFPRYIKEVLFRWNNKESLTSVHLEDFLISFPKPGTSSTIHHLTHAPTTTPFHSSIIALCMSYFFGPWNNYCELLYMFPKLMISTWHYSAIHWLKRPILCSFHGNHWTYTWFSSQQRYGRVIVYLDLFNTNFL